MRHEVAASIFEACRPDQRTTPLGSCRTLCGMARRSVRDPHFEAPGAGRAGSGEGVEVVRNDLMGNGRVAFGLHDQHISGEAESREPALAGDEVKLHLAHATFSCGFQPAWLRGPRPDTD